MTSTPASVPHDAAPMVILTADHAGRDAAWVKQRYAVLGAIAIGLMVAFLLVGRARAAEPAGSAWAPAAGASWQYQLDGAIDTTVAADIFDVDLDSTKRAVIDDLHTRGRHVLCYIDAGSWEPYRPDSGRFPASVKGGTVDGWPDERWLDIRRLDVLRPLLRARLDRCAAKGFDGVEFDWIDGYVQHTGFAITKADQLRYDRWLAQAAHARGLLVAQKNGPGLVKDLVATWDLAVTEECFQYAECSRYRAYLDAGKPVLDAEYALATTAYCDRATASGVSAIRKHLRLDAWSVSC